MTILKKILKALLLALAAIVFCVLILIVYVLVSDYKPGEKETVSAPASPSLLKDSLSLTLMTWNIGYAGLDSKMDFFYDGGSKVRTSEKQCRDNIRAIGDFLKENDTLDFIILQEVDRNSKRSYGNDELDMLSGRLEGYNSFFAKNYDVFFVPSPVSDPMGKVLSGIATFSKYVPESSVRYALPGNMGFPTQLFYLDRCFLSNRYKLENGKELILINTHNEAFDEGNIRKAQMTRLKEFITGEYYSGNYVITGGDWNQFPPDFKPDFSGDKAFTGKIGNFDLLGIESDYIPDDWKWLYDPSSPSFRTLLKAYEPSDTPTSTCDFFLISPNIETVSVKCHHLGFSNSDHNPVIIKVHLK